MPPDDRRKPLTRTEALRRAGRDFEADAAQRAYAKGRPELVPFTTTLWDYPSRSYGSGAGGGQGNQRYAGATPGWVIWQLLHRYSAPGESVLDPMCGSGTTLDVCRDLGRRGIGFDLNPQREDIGVGDARVIALDDASVDFVFVDPPYSTHIDYSDDPRCIGKLDALERNGGGSGRGARGGAGLNAYYTAMDAVIGEIDRVLRPGRHMGLFVSDSFRKGGRSRKGGGQGSGRGGEPEGQLGGAGFEPIGFELFSLLRRRFEAVDIVAVVRRNAKLGKGNWAKAAEAEGFMMRGFNYLFIMKKGGRSGRGR
ncbi:MAG: DNA methyltransferase [Phycisphaerales bacterium]